MNREKTAREWLEELPEGYRERALAQVDPHYIVEKVSSIDQAVGIGIIWWSDTKEDSKFWLSVHDHFLSNGRTPLPPLPNE